MVFFQWAALPPGRLHGTARAVVDGTVQLCVSAALLDEVRDLLSRPAIQALSPHLTPERVDAFLHLISGLSVNVPDVPNVFTLPAHPDDDHVLNLAIHARARYLITWEARLLKLAAAPTPVGTTSRQLAPDLLIVNPKEFAERMRAQPPSPTTEE
jgi:putative PIN family toxin of toxin-antitoxin system